MLGMENRMKIGMRMRMRMGMRLEKRMRTLGMENGMMGMRMSVGMGLGLLYCLGLYR